MPSELNFLLGSAIALFLLGITSMLVALRLQCSLRGTRSNIATATALGARPASLSASKEEPRMFDRKRQQEAEDLLRNHLARRLPKGGDYSLEIRYLNGEGENLVFEAVWSANFAVSRDDKVSRGPSYLDERGRDKRR